MFVVANNHEAKRKIGALSLALPERFPIFQRHFVGQISTHDILTSRTQHFALSVQFQLNIKLILRMTTIAQQIEILQARFAAPSSVKFQSHYVQVTGSEEPSTIAPCCQAARSVLRSSVVACAAKNGVPGVIEYFTNRFSWGCYPCQYYCECFRHADELFCTGTMCVGLEALDIARAHCTAPVPFDLVTVELIIVQSRDVINSSKVDVADSQRTHPNKFISGDWLLADTMYHNVVGLVDRNLQLTICDYDAQFIFHHDKNLSEERVAAIRVCAWTGGDTKDSFLSAKDVKSAARRLSWSGMTIPLGKWFSIPAGAHLDSTHCSAADPLNVLGAVYGAKQHPESLVSRAGTAAQSSVAKRKVPDADTTAGLVTVSLDSVESHISTDSLESLLPPATLAYPHTSMHPPEVKQSPSIDAEHSKSAGSAGRLPTVLISGIYMGPNPCPGMGVARALRACYGDRVNLIALDDAKFSDPVFDSLQQVFEMGSTLCGATASKQRQWDTVARLLLEHLRDSDGNTAPFYIPVSTQPTSSCMNTLYNYVANCLVCRAVTATSTLPHWERAPLRRTSSNTIRPTLSMLLRWSPLLAGTTIHQSR